MPSSFNGIVAIATIHFHLASVQFVTERDRLFWLMVDVNNIRMDCSEQTGRQIATHCQPNQYDQDGKFVNPRWKMKLLPQ